MNNSNIQTKDILLLNQLSQNEIKKHLTLSNFFKQLQHDLQNRLNKNGLLKTE